MAQWTLVFSSPGLPEAELMRGLLLANEIEAILVDKRSSNMPQLGEAEVYVGLDDSLRARFILEKHRS